VRRATAAALALAASVIAFAAAVYARMDAAYGPFNLSLSPSDWTVLWELLRYGQIRSGIVAQSAALGLAAAIIPWAAFGIWMRRRRAR
jgi:hypothetical protein